MRHLALLALALAPLVAGSLVAGCSGGGSSGGGAPVLASAPVDATGGTATGANGLTVSVPSGAVAQAVAISVVPGTEIAQSGFERAGDAYALGPAGQTFSQPVRVTLPVNAPSGVSSADLIVAHRDDDTGVVSFLLPVAHTSTTVTVELTSFSTLQALHSMAPAPSLQSVTPSAGSSSGGTSVVLTGQNFRSGDPQLQVFFGLLQGTVVSVSADQIQATAPAVSSLQTVNVSIRNGDGLRSTNTLSFRYAVGVLGPALFADQNLSGQADAGDRVIVRFGGNVSVGSTTPADFTLPVSGDSLGSNGTVTGGPAADQITITLGAGAVLRSRGAFQPNVTSSGQPSGIDVAATAASLLSGGQPVAPSTAVDVLPDMVDTGQLPSTVGAHSVVVGDVDGDGDADMLLGDGSLFLNDGGANFTQTQTLRNTTEVVLAFVLQDLDRDGDRDVVTGNNAQSGIGGNRVWLNNGSGTFTDSGQSLGNGATFGLACGDVDGDTDPDLVVGNLNQPNRVWLNDGSGNFSDSGQALANEFTRDLVLGDIDGDGDLDIVTANGDADRVWLNDGTGVFSDSGQLIANGDAFDVDLGDVDGDGDLDLLEACRGGLGQARILFNNGAGVFAGPGTTLATTGYRAGALVDYDGDGDLDVVLGADVGQPNEVFLGDGSGQFRDSGLRVGSHSTFGLAIADLDGDGDLDWVAANNNGSTPRIYRQSSP